MSTEAAKMRIEFEVGAGGVEQGVQVATTSIEEFLSQFKNTKPAADGASLSFGKLTDTLRDYKSEQVQNSRLARYFAGEIASIIPGAEGATASIQKLLAAGAGGFGIGLAIDGVLILLGQVADSFREQEHQAQALRQIHRDTWKSASDALDEYRQGLSTTQTASDKVWTGITKRVHDEVSKIEGEIEDYQNSFAAHFRDGTKGLMALFGFDPDKSGGPIEGAAEKIAKMREKQQAALSTLSDPDIQEQKRLAAAAEGQKKHAEFLREQERLERETDDEIVRIQTDLANKKETLLVKDFKNVEDYHARIATLEADAAEKIRRIREDRALQEAAKLRTIQAQNGTEIERLDADHENRLAELRAQIRRTSLAGEQQRIRQEIADATAGYTAKRDLLQREQNERLRQGAADVDRKKYQESLGYLQSLSEIEDAYRARTEANEDEQLARELLRIQQSHDRELSQLEILLGQKAIKEDDYQRYVVDLEKRTSTERARVIGEASRAGEFINPLVQNWQQGLEQMLSGTYNWSNLTRNVLASLVGAFAQGASQMATQWLGQEALKFAGWAALKVKELALHSTTEVGKTTATLTGVAARVPAEAGEAAVLAGQSAAGIPGIGWLIALPAAGAVLGGLLAYGLSSAANGYDIGSENPITRLHAREMVLPASIAEPLRQSLAAGGLGGGGGDTYHVTVQAFDATGVERVLQNNEAAVVRFVSQAKKKNRIT